MMTMEEGSMQKTRIVVMEDDDDTLEMVRFLLERAGYEVLTAKDGKQGLELARQSRPGLILLDLAMPEMDGWSVAGELEADPEMRDIPVVALTAYTQSYDRRRALNAGCDGFIPKPMNVAEFVGQVERFLKWGGE
jgi:two-component system cell cycle response regulator DivK